MARSIEGEVLAHERLHHGHLGLRGRPIRVRIRAAMGAPTAEWSCAPATLPMSCSRAPSSSRSGRSTSRTRPVARTTVSIRCRSTVCRWTGLRCGRLRTSAHSGIHGLDDAGEVQALPHRDQAGPGGEQVAEQRERHRRPRCRAAAPTGSPGWRWWPVRAAGSAGPRPARRAARAGGRRTGRPTRRARPRRRARTGRSPAGFSCGRRGPTRRVRARWACAARRTVPSRA